MASAPWRRGGMRRGFVRRGVFSGGRGPHAQGLLGEGAVGGGASGVGEDGDGGDGHFAEGADDADGDLAAIGDENLAEHAEGIVAGGGRRLRGESHLSNAEPAGAGRIGGFTGYAMALDSIEGSLKERGVRLTRQRQILLELIDKTGEHLDAERLFQMAKEKDPKLNRVTVYRTLKMLKVSGLVDELDLMHHGGDQQYY